MTLNPKQQAILLLVGANAPERARELLALLPPDDSVALQKAWDDLQESSGSETKRVCAKSLRQFLRPQIKTYLPDVHDDWILESLQTESPAIVAVILRLLPADRVARLLKVLPKELTQSMPSLSDVFASDPRLVELLRAKFENTFALADQTQVPDRLEVEHLYLFRARDIRDVFLGLGYREIALGLTGLPELTQNAVLGRLLPEHKSQIHQFMKSLSDADLAGRVRKAQVHLISKEVHPRHPEAYIIELGHLVFAKAVTAKEWSHSKILCHKMSLQEARALTDTIASQLKMNSEVNVLPYQEEVRRVMQSVLRARSNQSQQQVS